jgi:hypothetical protein
LFGRKERARLFEVIEQLRADVAAHNAQVQTLQESLAQERERQSAGEARTRQLQEMSVHTAEQISRAVDDLVRVCEVFGERVQSAHSDHYALVEVIGHLIETTRSQTTVRVTPAELSSSNEQPEGVGTEVWCRFQNRWIGGFEIAETLHDGNERRFKIRRNSDGYILPVTFSAGDVRPTKPA